MLCNNYQYFLLLYMHASEQMTMMLHVVWKLFSIRQVRRQEPVRLAVTRTNSSPGLLYVPRYDSYVIAYTTVGALQYALILCYGITIGDTVGALWWQLILHDHSLTFGVRRVACLQGMLVTEMWMDRVAHMTNKPLHSIREMNLYKEGQKTHFGQTLTSSTLQVS